MTPQEINIAIAEWCGWRLLYDATQLKGVWVHPNHSLNEVPPDYYHDLNAVHEVERHGGINHLDRYADELDSVCVPTHICPLTHWQSVVMATAPQRCEALLRTVGKWKEGRK